MSQSLGNTTEFSSQGEFSQQYGNVALRFYLQNIARELLPNERIQVCWRYPLPARKTIEIIYSDERQCARSNGTMKCGSGWVCPVCMRYIAERRRDELQTAMKRSNDRYFTMLLTYTARHTQGDRLKDLLSSLLDAYNHAFSGRWWSYVKEDYMIRGAVRGTEITYGDNGWHPHFHVLTFVDRAILDENYAGSPDEYIQSVKTQFGGRWLESLEKKGLSGISNVAFDARTADSDIAEYIAKFGKMPVEWLIEQNPYEMTHSQVKTPRNGNFGPLDILFAAARDERYKRLFLEYHDATKGRSALQWSKGLKKELDIDVIRDEIAAEGVETETDRILAEIDLDLWRYISSRGHMGQVMTVANTGEAKHLEKLLGKIRGRMEKSRVEIRPFDLGH